jgi:hypothetical protein
MRTRTSLYWVLSVLGGVLLATVVFLVACAGPSPSAGGPDPGPSSSTDPDPAATAVAPPGGSGGGGGWTKPNTPPHHTTKPTPPKPTHTTTPPKLPVKPPAFGQASIPGGSSYSLADDRQAFTMVFSTVEIKGQKSRTVKTTLPLTGDTSGAVIEFAVQGYAFTTEGATAKLRMTACGLDSGQNFHERFDDDYIFTMSVPLRGKHSCPITMTLSWQSDNDASDDIVAYADILSLDARFI